MESEDDKVSQIVDFIMNKFSSYEENKKELDGIIDTMYEDSIKAINEDKIKDVKELQVILQFIASYCEYKQFIESNK